MRIISAIPGFANAAPTAPVFLADPVAGSGVTTERAGMAAVRSGCRWATTAI
jgi:hypothetical protein